MRCLRHTVLLVAAVLISANALRAADALAPLRLVGSVGGQTWDNFAVEKGEIVIRDGERTQPLPRGMRWRLEGDLRAHVESVSLVPAYEIATRPSLPPDPNVRTRTHSIIWLRRDWPWQDRELVGAIAIFLWLVDGRVVWVSTRPTVVEEGPSGSYAAVNAWELDAGTVRGVPAVLLLKDGKFVAPDPVFADGHARAALVDMHFGSAESFEQDVAQMKSPNPRLAVGRPTLLHYAAEGGFVDAVRTLLGRGAAANLGDEYGCSPLHLAAVNGRHATLDVLIAGGARLSMRNAWQRSAFEEAIDHGHAGTALALLGEKPGAKSLDVLRLAVAQGDTALVAALLPSIDPRRIAKMPPRDFAGVAHWNDSELVRLLIAAGAHLDPAGTAQMPDSAVASSAEPIYAEDEVDLPPLVRSAASPAVRRTHRAEYTPQGVSTVFSPTSPSVTSQVVRSPMPAYHTTETDPRH